MMSTGFDRARRRDGAILSGITRKRIYAEGKEAVVKLRKLRKKVEQARDECNKHRLEYKELARAGNAEAKLPRAEYAGLRNAYQNVLNWMDGEETP